LFFFVVCDFFTDISSSHCLNFPSFAENSWSEGLRGPKKNETDRQAGVETMISLA
jgi:hypothetical protein